MGKRENVLLFLNVDNGLGRIELVVYSSLEKNGGFSSYEIVNQIAKGRSKLEERERRFDVTLLISGLPIFKLS